MKGNVELQTSVIAEMDRLCHPRERNIWNVHKAARYVSGEDGGEYSIRQSPKSLVRISNRTVIRWWKHWMAYGMLPCSTSKKMMKECKSTTWTDARIAELKRIIDDCPVLYLDEISTMLLNSTGQKFSRKSISLALRLKLRYTRKIVYEKASQQILSEKALFVDSMNLYIQKPEMAIFVDESNKDRL